MVKPGYKMTEMGEMPEEWELIEVSDSRICKKIKAGGTPLKTVRQYYEDGTIPFVKIEDIVNSGKYLTKTSENISEEGLINSSAWLVPINSILFSMYASYGEVSINKIPVATNQAIISIIPNTDSINLEFFYYELSNMKKEFVRFLRSTTQKNLNAEIVKKIKIPIPPLPEQQKIAEILSTVDNVIQKINDQIGLTEKLKKALMQQLLTKGIGHTKFKMTEIGEIPDEWKVVRLGDVSKTIKGKKPSKLFDKKLENTIAYLTAEYMRSKSNVMWCNKNDPNIATVIKDDLLMIWDGSNAGEVFIGYEGALASTMIKIISTEKLKNSFFYYFLTIKFNFLRAKSSGTGVPHVSKNVFENLLIPVPPVEEQQKIAEILSTVDEKINLLKTKKDNLEKVKKRLMDDLFTGKVRVKI